MTKLVIKQSENSTEYCSAGVVTKLYQLLQAGVNTSLSSLVGSIRVNKTYRKYVEYIQDHAISKQGGVNKFHITVDNYLAYFEDPAFGQAVSRLFGRAPENITESLAASWFSTINNASISTSIYNTNVISALFNNNDVEYIDLTPLPQFEYEMYRVNQIYGTSLKKMNFANGKYLGMTCAPDGSRNGGQGAVFYKDHCSRMREVIAPEAVMIGTSALYQSNIQYVYAPKCVYLYPHQFRDEPNLELIYFGSNLSYISSNISDHNNSNYYSPLSIVIDKPISSSADLPKIFSNVSITYVSGNDYKQCLVDYGNATYTIASSLNTANNKWGYMRFYVPSDAVNIYKTTAPWSSIASNIYSIGELSYEHAMKIQEWKANY